MATTSLTYGLFARDNASPVFARLSRNISSTGRQASGFSASFAKMGAAVGFAAKSGALALGAMAAAGATAGIRTAASLQQAQISFETLLGSAERASKFLKNATNFAARTPFQTEDVIGYSRALLGAGQAAKDILPTLTAWGDTSGALGQSQEQFGRTMIAVTQIMNKGKLQAEELMQISESGIPIWGELSKALGMPIPAIQDLMKEGRLLSKDVLPALQAQLEKDYGGAMGRQAKTLTGLWSTFKDTLSLGLAKAVQPLIPLLANAMPAAMEKMGAGLAKVAGWIAVAIPKVQDFFTSFKNSSNVQGYIGWLTGSLIPALKNAAERIFPALQQAWGDISNVIAENQGTFRALGALLTDVIIPILAEVARIVAKVVGPAFTSIVVILRDVVIPVFSAFVAGVLTIFQGLIKGAAWVAKKLHLPFAESLQRTSDEFSAFVADTNAKLAEITSDVFVQVHVQPVVESVQTATHNKGFIGPTMAEGLAAKGIAGPYTNEQRGVYAKAKDAGKAAGKAGGTAFAGGFESSVPEVEKAGDKVKSAAQKKFDEIKAAADQLRSSVHDSVMGFFTLQSEGNPFANLGRMAKKAVAFAAALGRLTKQGVNPAVISMIAQAGPDVGLRAAQMLSTAGKANRGRINNAYERIDAAANRAAGYVVGAQTPDSLGVARSSLGELRAIRKAVTRHHKSNPLANGWAAY